MQPLESAKTHRKIIIYYAIACAWSWPFFWWRDIHPDSWKAIAAPGFLKTWVIMWGPGISALICFWLFGTKQRTVSFFGTSIPRSIIAYFIPVALIFLVSQKQEVFYLALLGFVSTLGEELGWRGWLQDQTSSLSDIKRALLIGSMWEFWHFTNRTAHGNLVGVLIRVSIGLLVLSIVSYIAIKATRRTQSLVTAVAIHLSLNALFEFDKAWIAILCAIPLWLYLLKTWPHPRPKLEN